MEPLDIFTTYPKKAKTGSFSILFILQALSFLNFKLSILSMSFSPIHFLSAHAMQPIATRLAVYLFWNVLDYDKLKPSFYLNLSKPIYNTNHYDNHK